MNVKRTIVLLFMAISLTACAHKSAGVFRDPNMDFGVIQNVAVMPLANQSKDQSASDRVREVLMTRLLATGAFYVIPVGEVKRGTTRLGLADPTAPSTDEVIKFSSVVKVDAVITGVVKEYGEVRSGSAASNAISLNLQMIETQTGRIIWSASSTQGGIGVTDRLFGGGGTLMNDITEKAVDDLIKKLFK